MITSRLVAAATHFTRVFGPMGNPCHCPEVLSNSFICHVYHQRRHTFIGLTTGEYCHGRLMRSQSQPQLFCDQRSAALHSSRLLHSKNTISIELCLFLPYLFPAFHLHEKPRVPRLAWRKEVQVNLNDDSANYPTLISKSRRQHGSCTSESQGRRRPTLSGR
jgi:hypothetical protein